MAPMTGRRAWWGAGIPEAIKMAFEDINARNDILKGYRLELITGDTQVSLEFNYNMPIVKHFFKLLAPVKNVYIINIC